MAFDGITIAGVIHEMKENIIGGRIDKIYQPEKDEIVLSVRSFGRGFKLLLTSNASHPRLHFTTASKENPKSPPAFCMVLRKHLNGGKILDVTQPGFERIVNLHIESMNELGDFTRKKLIIEVMGRHSNLILVDDNDVILDSAKRVSLNTSSYREVLPGRQYIFPPSKNKLDTMELEEESFLSVLSSRENHKIQNAIYEAYTGISPVMASEICFRADADSSDFCLNLSEEGRKKLFQSFSEVVGLVKSYGFAPEIIKDEKEKSVDFSAVEMKQFFNYKKERYESVSGMLEDYYAKRDGLYRITQKSSDLRRLVLTNIERCVKKKEIQQNTLKETLNRESLRLYGELITANIHNIQKGMTTLTTVNFYDEAQNEITIPLDPTLTPSENAQKYFKKYNKAKRTFEALKTQIKQNDGELDYLDGVLSSIEYSADERDIAEIRSELMEQGFIKFSRKAKNKQEKKSKPLHFISSDGFDIYVGKNNNQNDELTLKFARAADIWLHTKNIPGSHVIIASNNKTITETAITEAAHLAAFYSKGKNSSLVPVDYTEKRNVKKPSGAKPGFVIYEKNKTAYITPDYELVQRLEAGSD